MIVGKTAAEHKMCVLCPKLWSETFLILRRYDGDVIKNVVLVGKPEGKRSLGRPRRRWDDNIKMDIQEVECGGMDWIELDQDR